MTALTKLLEKAKKSKTVLLGVGNELRGDDAAGPLLIKRLAGKTSFILLDGGELPENQSAKIIALSPDILFIADAADMAAEAGKTALLTPEDTQNASFSTHAMPLSFLAKYLRQSLPALEIHIIGIQPRTLAFPSKPSAPVLAAVEKLAALMEDK